MFTQNLLDMLSEADFLQGRGKGCARGESLMYSISLNICAFEA